MPKKAKIELADDELIEEMEKLEKAVRSSVISPRKQMFRGFITGLFSALGALVAAAIVIPLLVYVLSSINWIPLIGNFADQLLNYIKQ